MAASKGATAESVDVPVKSDISGFSPPLEKGAADTKRFADRVHRDMARVEAATRRAGKSSSSALSGGMANAAYGVSDAVTAFQFNGLRGAAIAASNNLPQMGAALSQAGQRMAEAGGAAAKFGGILATIGGPAGLIASIALPLGAMLLPKLLETKSETEKAAEAADKWAESLKRADEAAAKLRATSDQFKEANKGSKEAATTVAKQRKRSASCGTNSRRVGDALPIHSESGDIRLATTFGMRAGTLLP